jgi:UDP-2-acetamido-3-amino-2,3-dideoxy-glucuronate N-acetyltransferase
LVRLKIVDLRASAGSGPPTAESGFRIKRRGSANVRRLTPTRELFRQLFKAEGATFMPIAEDVRLGADVTIRHPHLVNLYGCQIGDGTRLGTFVEIQKGASVGARCKVSSHTFICEGVRIEDEVFIGHGVMFTNDLYPRATSPQGVLQTAEDWQVLHTVVRRGASIGSNATILPGLRIGLAAIVGAGSVVTRDVPDHAIVAGNPARVTNDVRRAALTAAATL